VKASNGDIWIKSTDGKMYSPGWCIYSHKKNTNSWSCCTAAALAYGMDKTEDRMWVFYYFFLNFR
jgi:hypothetical protein